MFLDNIMWFLHIHLEEKFSEFGTFHIVSLLILAAAVIAVSVVGKRFTDRSFRFMLICIWATLVLGEIYRELECSYNYDTGLWSYAWYQFPFQFCSSPLYVLPLAIFIPHKKTKQFFYDFLATYSLFAGFIVMLMPGAVLNTNSALVCVQSMVHHGAMVVVAAALYASGRVKFSIFTILRGTVVFVVLLAIAMILNVTIQQDGFNMFYIDWTETGDICHMPIIGDLDWLPYPVFFMIYTFGFMLCATIMHLLALAADGVKKLILLIARSIKKAATKKN